MGREDIQRFWTGTKIDRLKKKLAQNRLALAQFVVYQPVIEGLTSRNAEPRKRNLDYFEAGCRIGRQLGAPVLNIVAPWARELMGPTGYLPRYYEIAEPKPGEKFHIDIAPGFDWDAVWQT